MMTRNDSNEVPQGSSCMRMSARSLGVIGGFVAVIAGIWTAVSIVFGNALALGIGLWQALAGLICLVEEAPCSWPKISKFVRFPNWAKALFYVFLGAFPMCFIFSLGVWLGSGLIFCTGVLYGFISIGKRASMEDMQTHVSGTPSAAEQGDANRPTSSGMHSSLVDNAQPMGRNS